MDKVCGPPFEVTVKWYLFYIRLNKQVSKTQLLYVDDSFNMLKCFLDYLHGA